MRRFVIAIIGLLFLGAGIFLFVKDRNMTRDCTAEAEATVVDMEAELSTESDGFLYYPIIEYKAGETTVRERLSRGSGSPAYDVGDKITVLYNPDDADEFIVKGEKTSSVFSIVFMVLGLLVTGYGVKEALKKE